jgi:hypothetical protein
MRPGQPKAEPTPIVVPSLTANQKALLANPARILWCGAGTKTGKTFALSLWVAEAILKGQRAAWVGPWFARTRTGFEAVRTVLSMPISRGDVVATDGLLRIATRSGGRLDCYSGDNPEALYGDAYHRVVIDEASRMKETILPAALTTVSATKGRIRLAFNLERGRRNWAISNLLRVRSMTATERRAADEDFMTFPSLSEGLVEKATIELMRTKMPEAIWRALYLAEIPDSDVALFRNLDEVFCGQELTAPMPGRRYVMGVDLARKSDYTVAVVIDDLANVVAADRFNEVSWSIQYERVAALYRRFGCSKVFADATGIGDVIVEELRKRHLQVEPVVFTAARRTELIEGLAVAFDSCAITLPATPRFEVFREELAAMEYQFDSGSVRYGAPASAHDDCVMALALGIAAAKTGRDFVADFYAKRAAAARAEQGLPEVRSSSPHRDEHDSGRYRSNVIRGDDLASLENCGRDACPFRWRLRTDERHPQFAAVDLGRVADLSGVDADRLRLFAEGNLDALDADERARRLTALTRIAEETLRARRAS